ncbi:hypothetical protein FFLO_06242 [Filobasidium floriforme]|uniref:MARVEL domain-containing protein n=1 Tax=Filobasidium floriforme TaxID=5210 RepID=A0A8K0NMD3_9TREE|nr:uncharacterized protein HD553DRAFT_315967 [Filobasidium floriforme]KAG7528331.1 hypothetical protein FFLO_06242 [Filobasidium floriforme]KAH8081173.1 hypothetical protein HD553DRAFT_315967 [Filobasidium floriforme]
MPSERSLKILHTPWLVLSTITSIVALAISASLVDYYNNNGYPAIDGDYKPRIRIVLVASVWMAFFSIYLLVGFLLAPGNILFGILAHWVALTIGFLLFLIGNSSLTSLTDGTSCGNVGDAFRRCNIVKGLVVVAWIDVIVIFVMWLFVTLLAWKARKALGIHRSSLLDAWLAW